MAYASQQFPGQVPANPGDNPVYYPHSGAYGAPVQPQAQTWPQPQPQPQPQQPMVAAPQASQQAGPPPPQTGEWNEGLCGCCSPCSTCFLACCVPCILQGKTADRMRDPSMKTAETFNNDCLISLVLNCLVGCGWIWTMQQRGKIREKYGIKGSSTNDCCVSYWCPCCATVQNDKEVVSRTKGLVTDGYQQQGGMQMKPQ